MYLYTRNSKTITVVAALLHDLLEDTDVSVDCISNKFGSEVTRLVEANTFKDEIVDDTQRYIELFSRNISSGREATLIKVADLLDNVDYYNLGEEKTWIMLFEKFSMFTDMSQPIIKDTSIYDDLLMKKKYLKEVMFAKIFTI